MDIHACCLAPFRPDLCEDPELQIRIYGIKGLHAMGAAKPELIPRIADVLAQLLLAEDVAELKAVKETLEKTLQLNPRQVFLVLLTHINDSEEALRAKTLEFFSSKMMSQLKVVKKDEEFQDELIANIKKVLLNTRGIPKNDFGLFSRFLQRLPKFTAGGAYGPNMAAIVDAQIELPTEFNPEDQVLYSFSSLFLFFVLRVFQKDVL